MTDVPRYEIVVVGYRSRAPLSRLLTALGDRVPVVVVDNAADVDSLRDLVEAHPSARYLDAGGNRGFAAAANLGAAASTAEVVVFVNPDCLPSVAVLDELARYLAARPDVASCMPALHDAEGRIARQGGGWAPTVTRCLVHATGGHLLLRRRGIWMTPAAGEVAELDWLAGTCLAVRRATFAEVGGFDEGYFLYNEDMALGDRFRRRGLAQVLRGDLAVEHTGGGSSAGASTALWLLRAASLARYVDQHNRRVAALTMRAVLAAGSLVRLVAASVVPGHRHRRPEMQAYVVGALRPGRATEVAVASLHGVRRTARSGSAPRTPAGNA